MQFRDEQIAAYDGNPIRGVVNYGDLPVPPGIVGPYGDTFERAVMLRSGVIFPYETALADADDQLLAYGITTEFHGITHS